MVTGELYEVRERRLAHETGPAADRDQLRHGRERGEGSVLDEAQRQHPQLRMVSKRLERCDARAGHELCVPKRTEGRERLKIRDLGGEEPEHLELPEHLDSVKR